MKDALESRLGKRIGEENNLVPWLVSHAAATVNWRRKDQEGSTAYRRWKGKEFKTVVAEFGECVWYLKAASVGKEKFQRRWEDGIFLGVRD